MRNLRYIFLLLMSVVLVSCDSTLELEPEDFYGINNYWKTPEQCNRFMIGLHFRMRERAEFRMKMGELRGGTLNTSSSTSIGEGANDIAAVSNNLSEANCVLSNWCDFYMDIYQINHAIEKIGGGAAPLDEQTRNTYLGQLYGMRAFYYFYLLRTWGGVPLCDKPDVLHTDGIDVLNKPRSSEQEIWDFICEDLVRSEECYENIGFANYKGKNCYWNKAATYCLKAEVYMWGAKVKTLDTQKFFSTDPMHDLTEAKNALEALEGRYSLNAQFKDAFSPFNKDANKETIFAIRYKLGEKGNYFGNFTYNVAVIGKFLDKDGNKIDNKNALNIASGAMRYEYSEAFAASFAAEDNRHDATFYNLYLKDASGEVYVSGRALCKFIGEMDNGKNQYSNDVPVYRYADVLLMLAEIHNDLGNIDQAKYYLKQVRQRAFAGSTAPAILGVSKEEIEQEILDERKKEFVCEGKVWFDIRRMLGAEQALKLVDNNALKLVWPIDAGVLSKDTLVEQNKGYAK